MLNDKVIGITYGTFDLLHVGHINLLKRAKSLCDFLIVGLSTDEFNYQKGKRAIYSFQDRKNILSSIKYVDLIIPETNWEQKILDIDRFNVDLFIMGSDWTSVFDNLNAYCDVIYLPRTEGISTTIIKGEINNAL